ncbi:MAG: phosphatidylserine/phosphatidylglycerophosphate/cardiolipin synthase family protein [Gammaproteobacteria bacterium]|nr:MAG: phosphatidylserine/phosphatidylglycerophosphate/cardiolipin synthase family protein [Gammaproteobacteria bacterium]TLZ08277.1 MAG: phosphatidylserine/phosphatidylglycerophosphate/cardiolipin synthase family protein [Gammaproteobacteria bacterium]TLZ09379.1 MAG: phosphatidylserine/phosphatidylglycerophosphate/cardiolipin synthase family protein [Gammaproteobacteria bacterium]TLZ18033.1 MAG: phosphatidylserine/phosphatidylglycerophosphate/cardiolipin synthase family protein [Gammaproteobac
MTAQPDLEQFTTTGWPWRLGNEFRLLNDGGEFFARMLAAIEEARRYVLLEMYLVRSGAVATRFIDALGRAAGRGARVSVVFDGFGALGLTRADRRRLLDAGIELRFFNPLRLGNRLSNLLRDHRKLLLADGRVAFVGGAGLTDDFAPGARRGPWRELMVEIQGAVIADWQRAFARTWRRCGPELALVEPPACEAHADGAAGRLSLSEARQRSVLANGVLRRIDSATARAWIMSAYFVPSRRFRKALRRAARRGVDVRLLLPGARTDHPWVRQAARRFYGKLLRNGVKIFEYQPRMLHAKMILCDDWVSIGSSNLDRWSFRWNLEANQEIADADFANAAAAVFAGDFAVSRALSRRYWRQRAWLDRLRETIAGVLDRELDRWR